MPATDEAGRQVERSAGPVHVQAPLGAAASIHKIMPGLIRAALAYFAIVLGTGFLLGMVRVPLIVPRIGERWAELAEMPLMAVTIFLGAGYILRRFPAIQLPRRALLVGFLALALSVIAELGLALALQSQTLGEFLASRDPVSGSVYLAMLVAFALMPRLRLQRFLQGRSP